VSDKVRLFIAAGVLALLAAFALGGVWIGKRLWPYGLVQQALDEWTFQQNTDFGTKPSWAMPIAHAGDGVVVNEAGRPAPGLTLIGGMFRNGLEIRLVDLDGKAVNTWPLDFHRVWPEPTHIFPQSVIPKFKFGYNVHGLLAEPDGDVVFNFDGLGLVKMNRCGAVQWKIDRRTHHSITPDGQGGYWALAHRDIRDLDPHMVLPARGTGRAPRSFDDSYNEYENLLLHIDADGKVIKEFSLLASLFKVATWPELFEVADPESKRHDPMHVNDIEIVTRELARRIPAAKPGDLLLSIRNLHMLAIIDPQTEEFVWRRTGPWVRQHDVDILPDGRLSLYDNNDNHSYNRNLELPGSRIVQFAPDTGQARQVIPTQTNDYYFYSRIYGRHQYLPNGDMLVIEPLFGNVMEFAQDGKIVWQYVAPVDDKRAAIITEAQRFAPGYFTVADWSCPAQ